MRHFVVRHDARPLHSQTRTAEGDNLSFPRLQQILGLTPGNLITHLRKLEVAGYVRSAKPDGQSALSLTHSGRAALGRYTENLRRLLDQASPPLPQ